MSPFILSSILPYF